MPKIGWLSIEGIVIICIVKLDHFYTIRYKRSWLKRDRLIWTCLRDVQSRLKDISDRGQLVYDYKQRKCTIHRLHFNLYERLAMDKIKNYNWIKEMARPGIHPLSLDTVVNLLSNMPTKLLRKLINGHHRFESILGKLLSSLHTDDTENGLQNNKNNKEG